MELPELLDSMEATVRHLTDNACKYQLALTLLATIKANHGIGGGTIREWQDMMRERSESGKFDDIAGDVQELMMDVASDVKRL